MKNNGTFKQYATEAKSRMLKNNSFPSFVGKVPYKKYELLMKYIDNNDLLCKMCYLIENESVIINPISYLIDKDEFGKLSPENQQRLVFRMADGLSRVKSIYNQMNEEKYG